MAKPRSTLQTSVQTAKKPIKKSAQKSTNVPKIANQDEDVQTREIYTEPKMRKKRCVWTIKERECAIELVLLYKNTLYPSSKTLNSHEAKKAAWVEITSKYNEIPGMRHKTKDEVESVWQNAIKQARDAKGCKDKLKMTFLPLNVWSKMYDDLPEFHVPLENENDCDAEQHEEVLSAKDMRILKRGEKSNTVADGDETREIDEETLLPQDPLSDEDFPRNEGDEDAPAATIHDSQEDTVDQRSQLNIPTVEPIQTPEPTQRARPARYSHANYYRKREHDKFMKEMEETSRMAEAEHDMEMKRLRLQCEVSQLQKQREEIQLEILQNQRNMLTTQIQNSTQ